jgi:hypothetical protein
MADGLHLLRLAQTLFRSFTFCQVTANNLTCMFVNPVNNIDHSGKEVEGLMVAMDLSGIIDELLADGNDHLMLAAKRSAICTMTSAMGFSMLSSACFGSEDI